MKTQTGTLIFTTESGIDVYDCGDYFRFTLPITDGTTGDEWIARLKKNRFCLCNLCDWSKSVLRSLDFEPSNGITTEVAVLKPMLFKASERITPNIRKLAGDHLLETPGAEVACLIREQFTLEEIKKMGLGYIIVMHKPIKDYNGDLDFLGTGQHGDSNYLRAYHDKPGFIWIRECGFAFVVSQTNTAQEVL
jgi:hypothetical protein